MKRILSVVLLAVGLFAGQVAAKSYGSGGGSPVRSTRTAPAAKASVTPRVSYAAKSATVAQKAAPSNVGTKPQSSGSTSSGRRYGSGGGGNPTGGSTSPPAAPAPAQKSTPQPAPSNVGSKPVSGSGFAGSQSQKEQHSEEVYTKYNSPTPAATPTPSPKPTYTDARGQKRTVERDPQLDYLRGRLDGERYANRSSRIHVYYGDRYDYYRSRPVIVYNGDHYSSPFHYWLLDQPVSVRAAYVYNHRYDMDSGRYNLYMSDPAVAMEVNRMELQRISRNSYWTPTGWEYDGMFDDGYVTVAHNDVPYIPPPAYTGPSHFGHYFLWTLIWLAIAAAVLGVVWRIFLYDPERN